MPVVCLVLLILTNLTIVSQRWWLSGTFKITKTLFAILSCQWRWQDSNPWPRDDEGSALPLCHRRWHDSFFARKGDWNREKVSWSLLTLQGSTNKSLNNWSFKVHSHLRKFLSKTSPILQRDYATPLAFKYL